MQFMKKLFSTLIMVVSVCIPVNAQQTTTTTTVQQAVDAFRVILHNQSNQSVDFLTKAELMYATSISYGFSFKGNSGNKFFCYMCVHGSNVDVRIKTENAETILFDQECSITRKQYEEFQSELLKMGVGERNVSHTDTTRKSQIFFIWSYDILEREIWDDALYVKKGEIAKPFKSLLTPELKKVVNNLSNYIK